MNCALRNKRTLWKKRGNLLKRLQNYVFNLCIQSGELAADELVKDLEKAHDDGNKIVKDYFKERLFSKVKSIYDKLPRNKRKTFANIASFKRYKFRNLSLKALN